MPGCAEGPQTFPLTISTKYLALCSTGKYADLRDCRNSVAVRNWGRGVDDTDIHPSRSGISVVLPARLILQDVFCIK